MEKTAILIFAYNRPTVLKTMISSLFKNVGFDNFPVFIYCDGAKNNSSFEDLNKIDQVQMVIKQFVWPNKLTIVKSDINLGLANSIVKGVTDVLKIYERVIVLEDDIKTSPYFLSYISEALEFYSQNLDVISITGFNYPLDNNTIPDQTFFLKGTECWSWATWRRGWDLFEIDAQKLYDELNERNLFYSFDFNGNYGYSKMLKETIKRNHSWAVKWYASAYLSDKYTLFPKYSLVENIGDQGTNQSQNNRKLLGAIQNNDSKFVFDNNVVHSDVAFRLISKHFLIYNSYIFRVYNFILQKIRSWSNYIF